MADPIDPPAPNPDPSAEPEAELDVETGTEEAFKRFSAEAEAIPEGEVIPFRADATLAYHNVMTGLKAVLERIDEAVQRLPEANADVLRALPDLALALCFAVSQASGSVKSTGAIGTQAKETAGWRRLLLKGADAAVEKKLVPGGEIARIRAGRGNIDLANDCRDLAAWFKKNAKALQGKTAVTPEDVAAADAAGLKLLTMLKPEGARREAGAPSEAVDIRDRFWTLLNRRHEQLWKAGAVLWGRAVDDFVPALQSRVRRKKKTTGGEGTGGKTGDK